MEVGGGLKIDLEEWGWEKEERQMMQIFVYSFYCNDVSNLILVVANGPTFCFWDTWCQEYGRFIITIAVRFRMRPATATTGVP